VPFTRGTWRARPWAGFLSRSVFADEGDTLRRAAHPWGYPSPHKFTRLVASTLYLLGVARALICVVAGLSRRPGTTST
jgi:hypothetical protein